MGLRGKLWLLGVPAALGIALCWQLATQDETPAPGERPPKVELPRVSGQLGGCRGKEGFVASYRMRTRTQGVVEPAALVPAGASASDRARAKPQRMDGNVAAHMHVRVQSVQSESTLLALKLTNLHVDLGAAGKLPSEITRGSLAPYLFRLDRRCRVLEMGRRKDVPLRAARTVQGLLDAVQLALPSPLPTPGAEVRYQGTARDSFGPHVAGYVYRSEMQGGELTASLRRTRESYAADTYRAGELKVELRIAASNTAFVFDPGFWFASLTSKESTVGSVRGKLLVRATESASAERMEPQYEVFAGLALDLTAYVWGRVDMKDGAQSLTNGARDDLIGKPLDQFLEAWRALMALSRGAADSAALTELIDYLRANPSAATILLELVRRGELTAHERALLMHALGKAGTAEARAALHQAMQEPALGEHTRMQAVASAGELVNASQETVTTLIALSQRAPGSESEHDLVGNSATLALGSLLGKPGTDAKVSEQARTFLEGELKSEKPHRLSEALVAVGNSGDERFLPQVEARATSSDTAVRVAAAKSFRLMDAARTEPVLETWMRRERDPAVRSTLLASHREQVLEQGASASPGLLDAYIDQLRPGTPKEERIILINLLGQLTHQGQGRARQALIAHFPREPERELRRQIAQYVSAEELW